MKFPTTDLQALLCVDEIPGYETISNEIMGKSRWSVNKKLIFKHEGKFYQAFYSQGATEYQDEAPFEHEGPEVECKEVFEKQKTITVYE